MEFTSHRIIFLSFFCTFLGLSHRRSYYLTLKTMPLFLWALLITGGMLLLTLPILSGALLMVLADLHSNTLFFDPIFGGDPILSGLWIPFQSLDGAPFLWSPVKFSVNISWQSLYSPDLLCGSHMWVQKLWASSGSYRLFSCSIHTSSNSFSFKEVFILGLWLSTSSPFIGLCLSIGHCSSTSRISSIGSRISALYCGAPILYGNFLIFPTGIKMRRIKLSFASHKSRVNRWLVIVFPTCISSSSH